MKIAVVYNRESQEVINLFGVPNREKYGLKAIKRITNALKKGGHQAIAFEGDKNLIDKLEEFMPRVLKGERPGLVFNLSYGIQGQARYTHVPGILEMVGIPYVGSGPLAHSLALDKVVAKMIFRQTGLPTPDFAVLQVPGFDIPDLAFPLIVKPKNEAVSFGIQIVNNEDELRSAAGVIFEKFAQPVLVEQYIEGREINVGVLGNTPPQAFEPAELLFGSGGPQIYTYEDKTRKSGREISIQCPAKLSNELTLKAKELAVKAFNALGCYDCCRVDMRLDDRENLYILEINSLPSLGEHGSYVAAAEQKGLDFPALINQLVEVASARYFGTPIPTKILKKSGDPAKHVFDFLTQNRDNMESRLKKWSSFSSRTSDIVGKHQAVKELDKRFKDILLSPVDDLTNEKVIWTWQTKAGMQDGILIISQLDVPFDAHVQRQEFRRDPEWMYGEGVGAVWGPLTQLEFALRGLRSCRKLRKIPLGVLLYGDEGLDCRYSSDIIKQAANRVSQVIVLRPGNAGGRIITERRGQRKYLLVAEGTPHRMGKAASKPDVLRWTNEKLVKLADLSSRKHRLALSAVDIKTEAYPMLLPHRVNVTLLASYPTKKAGEALHTKIKETLAGSKFNWNLETVSERPPMKAKKTNNSVLEALESVAEEWELPFAYDSSLWPSVAGLVKQGTPVVCGMGPFARDLYTVKESVERISLIQKTLLLAQYLVKQINA